MKNPFRLLSIPAENRAEVTIAQIRESEETQRKATEQREATKRARSGQEGYWWIRFFTLAAGVGLALVGWGVFSTYEDSVHPTAGCVESAEVVGASDRRACPVGAWMSITTHDTYHVLVTCHCTQQTASSVAPASSVEAKP